MAPQDCNNNDAEEQAAHSQLIKNVRERFLGHFEEHRDFYDDQDVDKNVRNSDFFIERFIYGHNADEEKCLELLKDCMKFRKESVVHLTDNSFPREFFETGGLFLYKKDIEGHHMLYMRIKMIRKMNELEEHMKSFLVHNIEKADSKSSQLLSWAIVFDCSDIGIANVQIDILKYLIHVLRDYFPCGVKYILVVELPWILNTAQKMVFAMLPDQGKQLVQFKDKKSITKVIHSDNLPEYLGGRCKLNFRTIPQGSRTFDEMFSKRYGERELERIHQYFEASARDD